MNKLSLKKTSVKWLVAIAVFFVAVLVSCFIFASYVPKNTTLTSIDGKNVTDVARSAEGNCAYYSTNGGKIVLLNDADKVLDEFDLNAYTEEKYGVGCRSISKLYQYDGYSSLIAVADDLYLYCFAREDNQLQLKERVQYVGGVQASTYGNGYLYFLTKIQSYYKIYKYSANNLSEGAVASGYIYRFDGMAADREGNDYINLSLANGLIPTSMDVVGEYIYLIHKGGAFKISTDFEMNRFTDMSNEEREEKGAFDFKSSGAFKVYANKFDSDKYGMYYPDEISIRGSGYNRQNEMFYFVSADQSVHYYAKADMDELSLGELMESTPYDFSLPAVPTEETDALTYDAERNVGYVRYALTDEITKIDFNSGKILFSVKNAFNIKKMKLNEAGEMLYVLYQNHNLTESSEKNIFMRIDINKIANKDTFRTLTIISIVTAVVTVLVELVLFLCIINARTKAYVIDVLKGFIKHRYVYLILLGCMVLLVAFCYYPGVATMILSLFDYSQERPTMVWNNFANYQQIFNNVYAGESFRNMFIFLGTDLLFGLVPPVIFAFFLSIMRNKQYSKLMRMLMFIPSVVPSICSLMIWRMGIYGEYGVVNTVIRLLKGESVKFLTSTKWALPSLILMNFPFVGGYLIFYGAMMNIPSSYYEAAELEGCSVLRRLLNIDIPLILPQLKYVLTTTFIASVQNFGRTYMVTSGSWGTQTPINLMYGYMVNGEYGLASAYATVIFIFLVAVTVVNLRSQLKADKEGD